MRILIIDDDPSLRYMLCEICEHAGWVPLIAENGRVGLQQFQETEPRLVLVDYHMPEMDGIQVVREIRRRNKNIPILVLTVDERQEIADRFLREGATDFALKPVKAPDIISRIHLHVKLATVTNAYENENEVFATKGISKPTLLLITDFLRAHHVAVPIDEIAKEVGLAYPTVYRYVMHLLEIGKVEQKISHQKIGRPKKLYQWLSW